MIVPFEEHRPRIDATAFVAPSAEIIGRVRIGANSSVWYQAVLRGDVHDIVIGEGSNIQDHCVLHTTSGVSPCIVGDGVTVGHRVILHGCEIQNHCLIGMGAIIMDRSVVESHCLVAAGTLVPEGKRLKGGHLYAGIPAREIRPLREEEMAYFQSSATHYQELAMRHLRSISAQ